MANEFNIVTTHKFKKTEIIHLHLDWFYSIWPQTDHTDRWGNGDGADDLYSMTITGQWLVANTFEGGKHNEPPNCCSLLFHLDQIWRSGDGDRVPIRPISSKWLIPLTMFAKFLKYDIWHHVLSIHLSNIVSIDSSINILNIQNHMSPHHRCFIDRNVSSILIWIKNWELIKRDWDAWT